MDHLANGFLERLRMHVAGGKSLNRMADWLVQNTKDPRDPTKPWSFKGHEYQIEIANDTAPVIAGRKCSQVGFSELTLRLALGIVSIKQGIHGLYILPTAAFARTFMKSRFDPVIEASPTLSEQLSRDVDGADQKRIGNSFLYLKGTVGQAAAISIPATMLIADEVDFCDQTNLTTYESRLGHEDESSLIKRSFSTPTTSGRGVDKTFKAGDQRYYAVRHDRCGQVVVPDFFRDSVIPGYSGDPKKLTREDLSVPQYQFHQAYLLCPHCKNKIELANLCDPSKRMWVAAYPGRAIHSYQVSPFDVPTINPPDRTWRQMADYKRHVDWVNFKVGLPADDAENSILESVLTEGNAQGNFYGHPFVSPPEWYEGMEPIMHDTYMGVDIGKTSWVVIGKRDPAVGVGGAALKRKMRVLYVERIRQDGQDWLGTRLDQLADIFGLRRGVLDAAPDFTTSMGLVHRMPGRMYACQYMKNIRDGLQNVEVDEQTGIVKAYRTGTLDDLVAGFNRGQVVLPRMPEGDERALLVRHLRALRKVPKGSETSGLDLELQMIWESVDEDHYAHAMNYLLIAEACDEVGLSLQIPGFAIAGKARRRSADDELNNHPSMWGR